MITDLNTNNFSQAIENQSPILVDFWAEWCAPCRMMTNILHEVDKKHHLNIGKVNIDECKDLAMQFNISAIPTMIVFRDGQPVKTVQGVQSAEQVLALLQ